MIDLLKLEANDAERIAYAEGFTMAAELFARIADLEAERDALQLEIEDLKDEAAEVETLEHWENEHGSAEKYKEFFFDCFAHLAGHYPAPDISSEYDKSVIFEAIEKGADK
jgi:hypothetical protein